MMTPSTKDTFAKSRPAMRRALNVSQPYLEWISRQATGLRHADLTFVPGNVTTEIAHRTWKIKKRFLEYRKRGNTPLMAPEFAFLIESHCADNQGATNGAISGAARARAGRGQGVRLSEGGSTLLHTIYTPAGRNFARYATAQMAGACSVGSQSVT